MRGTYSRQRCYTRCVASLLLVVQIGRIPTAAQAVGSSGEEPWLAARMLEIPVTVPVSASPAGSGLPTERQETIDLTVRLDALLVSPEDASRRIRGAVAAAALDSPGSDGETSPLHGWRGWGSEDDQAIAAGLGEALKHAADSVYDQMEEEIVAAAGRGVDGDWLEAADPTCNTVVLQRRREILEVYRHGWLDSQSVVACPQATEDCPGCPRTTRCRYGVTAEAAARLGEKWERLVDSAASLAACRVFFDSLSEMEYAKAACLRAARLGNLSLDDAVEIDRRLAAIAFNHGRPAAAVQLYFRLMSLPSTNDDGRLAASITGLTMVPPAVIGSLRTMDEFRAGWVRDLRILRHNIFSGVTKGQLVDPLGHVGTTPFHLAHQGGPDLDLMSSLAGVYDVAAPSLRYTSPHCLRNGEGAAEGSREEELSGTPIRIGFFSSYLRDHSVGKMMCLLIATLADNSDLEIHVFGPDGGGGGSGIEAGEATGGDPVVEALRSAVHYWHQAPQELDKARTAVAREELDVLVYPDVGMEPLTYLMAFARLAPVQCVWWGHPVTPSTGAIDYFLSLDAEAEGGQLDYLEQMVRMDVINTAPFTQVIKAVAVAAVKNDNTALDVMYGEEPRSGGSDAPKCLRTYLVLGRLFKLHPDFDIALAGILAGDPSGCVVLIHETRDEEWTRTVWNRLRQMLLPQGLFHRLRIIHHWLYADALRRATVILDTFPYGGCLTVLEGLSSGVPVVTLPADFVRGRFALAMYEQMGYTDLVAENIEGYVSLAIRLGTEKAFAKQALARVEEGYRESLHKNEQSAQEWGAFFVRAFRIARFNNNGDVPQ